MSASQGNSQPARGRSCGGCLVRGCLGFLALCAGSSLALFLLGPPILGEFARSIAVNAFNAAYAGSLEVDDYDMSLIGEQSVSGLRLYDPEGREVLAGSMTFPGWLQLDEEENNQVALTLAVELFVDAGGESNLERALRTKHGSSFSASVKNKMPLEISVADSRLTWHSVDVAGGSDAGAAGWQAPTPVDTVVFDRVDGQVLINAAGLSRKLLWAPDVYRCRLKWAGGELNCQGTIETDPSGEGGLGFFFRESGGQAGLELEVDANSDLGRVLEDSWAGSLGAASVGGARISVEAATMRLPLDGWPGGIHAELTRPRAKLVNGHLSQSREDGAELTPGADSPESNR